MSSLPAVAAARLCVCTAGTDLQLEAVPHICSKQAATSQCYDQPLALQLSRQWVQLRSATRGRSRHEGLQHPLSSALSMLAAKWLLVYYICVNHQARYHSLPEGTCQHATRHRAQSPAVAQRHAESTSQHWNQTYPGGQPRAGMMLGKLGLSKR